MLRRVAIFSCAIAALACGRGRPERAVAPAPSVPAASAAPRPPSRSAVPQFEPPDSGGWGRAAGLRYFERCLGGAQPDAALPLVIMIHGLGDRPHADWFPGADAISAPLRLVMPQAPAPYHGGFAWFPFRVGGNDPGALARGIAAAEDRLARAIALLRAQRPTRGRAIVTGFSQGGMLSYALALRHPELVELSLPVAGMLPESLWPASARAATRAPEIAALHGDADAIVPIDPARRLIAHLRARGYRAALREYAGVGHQISDAMVAELVARLNDAAGAASGR